MTFKLRVSLVTCCCCCFFFVFFFATHSNTPCGNSFANSTDQRTEQVMQLGPFSRILRRMNQLFMLLLFCHCSSAVQHSLRFFSTGSSEVSNFPQFFATAEINDVLVSYCDIKKREIEPQYEWVEDYLNNYPQHLEFFEGECFDDGPNFFKATLNRLKQPSNKSEDLHVLQRLSGCEWDDETDEVVGFILFGYDGQDFLSLDLKSLTWKALRPEAEATKLRWDADTVRIKFNEVYLTEFCPRVLQLYLDIGNSTLLKKDLPSVSLLQQTPSSPVRCFASGFYPERASLTWRKDGDDLHEDVELGEILPNNDGNFQMSVDLKVSSVTPEDWRRYECVFQLSGVKDDIVTKLDKTAIRTNWEEPKDITNVIIASVVIFAIFIIAAIGLLTYKLRRDMCSSSSPINTVVLSEVSRSESCRS